MNKHAPRIPPLPESEWKDETRELLESYRRAGRGYNIFTTLARHPSLLNRWLVFGAHILSQSTLPAREREIAILRVGWLCRAEYEWGHHVAIGKKAGLGADDIARIAAGPDAAGWDEFEATLLRAVDELHANSFVSDSTWQALASRYNTEQLLDFLFTVGQYKLVSMVLNTVGIQLEEGFEGFASEIELPDVAKILAQALQHIDSGLRPALLAALERLAAQRYRVWANEHPDPSVKEGLLACAEREEEIARRVESLHPNAAEIQNKLLADHPELLELNRTLFEGRPLMDQFTMQAQGERAGAAAWRAFAAAAADPSAQELLQSCSPLEEANAAFLQSL